MNILVDILNFIDGVISLFAKNWAWCPVKVDNRIDRY